jgi:RimJ/RimL family protein N-acetyltransferase
MIAVQPVTLEFNGVRLEPLTQDHAPGLLAAVRDGELWNLTVTSAPEPDQVEAYIAKGLDMFPLRVPFAVIDATTNEVIGSTSYHDIVAAVDRLEVGYTWYAKSRQRSHVNTSCKLMLITHAFEVLGCQVVGLRTDNLNFASQAAIERIGAKRDGILRHHALRRDGTVRDSHMYSILRSEWPAVKANLERKLRRD